jgi:oligopeptide transport system ATP-binding protein
MSEILKVENLTKVFNVGKDADLYAVNNVSFTLGKGETLGLVGESGSGKTTVGRCVLRLIEPTTGKVFLNGVDVTNLKDKELRKLRSEMQLVFQDPFGSLNPRLTVTQVINEPLFLHGEQKQARQKRVDEMMELVGLETDVGNYYPADLTASEQQRVGIARALATKPAFVVLDEPTSMLDPSARLELIDVLKDIQTELGTSFIFISHDLTSVARISHRVAIMYLGHIIEVAPTEAILETQKHPYSKALLSAVLFPDPSKKLDPFVIEGEIPTAINPKPGCPLAGRCPYHQEKCDGVTPDLLAVAENHLSRCIYWDNIN